MQDPSRPIWFKQPEIKTETSTSFNFKNTKLLIATPVHSDVSIHYTESLLSLQGMGHSLGLSMDFLLLKSSLVTQGRNLCVANFLAKEEYTHLLFIDADISFEPSLVVKLLNCDKEVISIPYPMKTINWEKLDRLSKELKYKNATELSTLGFTYPIKVADTSNIIVDKKNVMEVTHAPTGCMLIKRQVFDKMIEKYPHLEIHQPTILNGEETKTNNLYNFFDTFHDLESKKYYGEDFGFCQKWRDIGGKCYCYIGRFITHVGEYQYSGRFRDELNYMTKIDEIDKNK